MEMEDSKIEHKKCSCVLIYNDSGKIALQLRAAHDGSFPSHWDFAAGGGIDAGEDEKRAAEREVREELGIEASVVFIARKQYSYPAWKPGVTREADMWLYKAKHSGPFLPDANEVEKVDFFPVEEIEQMIQSGQKFHPEFILVWNDQLAEAGLNFFEK